MAAVTGIRIVVHDVPAPGPLASMMGEQARELAARFPALLACRLSARSIVDESRAPEVQVSVELLLPEHQIILNRVRAAPQDALRDALAAAAGEIERLAARDPAIAPHLPALSRVQLPVAA